MDRYIREFPQQLSDALKIGEEFRYTADSKNIHKIIISGMGGSGIAGNFVQEYVYSSLNIPVFVNKSYHLPEWVDENTLVILSSYSGNTEETLSCLQDAVRKNAVMVGITSGGKLEEWCQSKVVSYMALPKNYPPRTCLGYSFVGILSILTKAEIISDTWKNEIREAIELLNEHQSGIITEAKEIAQKIHHTFPIIYTLHSESLAVRLRQQLNENSKVLCSHHIIPEMNHNEIVGWRNLTAQHSVIAIHTNFDLNQNRKRYAFCKKVFEHYQVPVIEMKAKGNTLLSQWMYIVHLSDWISYELALLNHSDPVEVKVIDQLKSELSK
ncbi:MAG: bifunctional phosphoglucose/phosphomannose isomerase [Bacteroidia bacterium]|nr:MAG: bifunctional phosphoglucose/phosphomannose isomerase [Bacteroidia bacterium]